MTLNEIKAAVRAGKSVRCGNDLYRVYETRNGEEFQIVCLWNGYTIGLTHADGVTMNGKPEEFYIREEAA